MWLRLNIIVESRAAAQAVSHQPQTVGFDRRSNASEICVEKIGTGTDLFPCTSVFPSQYHFICLLLSPEGQMDEACKPSTKQDRKVLSVVLSCKGWADCTVFSYML
jgi:hypothetical protein